MLLSQHNFDKRNRAFTRGEIVAMAPRTLTTKGSDVNMVTYSAVSWSLVRILTWTHSRLLVVWLKARARAISYWHLYPSALIPFKFSKHWGLAESSTFEAGLHVRRKHKHEHKPRVNRNDASTSASIRKRNALLFLVLALVLASSRFTRGLCPCLCL